MKDILQNIIREVTGDNSVVIGEDTSLLSEAGLSSYDLVQVVAEIEDRFDVEISDKQIRSFRTVKDVLAFLEKNA